VAKRILLFFDYTVDKLGIGLKGDIDPVAYVKASGLTEYLTLTNDVTKDSCARKLLGDRRINSYESIVIFVNSNMLCSLRVYGKYVGLDIFYIKYRNALACLYVIGKLLLCLAVKRCKVSLYVISSILENASRNLKFTVRKLDSSALVSASSLISPIFSSLKITEPKVSIALWFSSLAST